LLIIITMSEGTDLVGTKLPDKVSKILSHLYEKVESLEAFARAVTASSQSLSDAVVQSGDNASYVQFMKSTVVCTPHNARPMRQSWLLEQQSCQDEVILRVIERLRLREGRDSSNLLVIGYRLMSEDPSAQIASSSVAIEYRIANSNTSQLQYTPWKTLLSRIGDDVMEFLLETRTVFMPAALMCYVQLTGTPMYELWPFRRYYAQNQRNPTTQKLCTSLLHDSKCKSQKKRHRCRCKKELISLSKNTTSSIAQPCMSDQIFPESCAAFGQQENTETLSVTDYMETETVSSRDADINTQQHDSKADVKCHSVKKHKAETNLDAEPDAKRIARQSVPVSDNDGVVGLLADSEFAADPATEALHETAQVTVAACSREHRCKRGEKLHDSTKKEEGQTITTRKSVSTSDDEHVVGQAMQSELSADTAVETTCPQRTIHKTAVTGTASSQMHRRKRKGKLHDGNITEQGQKIMAFDRRLTIGRTPMFFSRDLTEKYPPKYVLFDANINNPLKLVANISSVRVLYNDQSSSVSCGSDVEILECYSDVKQRLLNVLQLVIKNHQICRYKHLLQHHCSFARYSNKPAVASEKRTCKEDPASLTMKTTPKLQVPVYCRGQKLSVDGLASDGLATTPVVVEEDVQPTRKSFAQTFVGRLLGRHCSHCSVFLFIRACCLRVLPTELFGSALNRNQFFRNVEKVVKMRRYEQLSLGCLMSSVKVLHCRWMKEIRSNTERLRLLAKLLCWLMNDFVMPLIKSYFYITDSTAHRNRMFYYRKSLWKKIYQKVIIERVLHYYFNQSVFCPLVPVCDLRLQIEGTGNMENNFSIYLIFVGFSCFLDLTHFGLSMNVQVT